MKLALALLALLATQAQAETTFGVHLGSIHDSKGFNNVNPGIYVRLDSGFTAGTVYNSERKQSVYAGWTFEHHFTSKFSAAVTVGGITGYAMPVTPMVIPSLAVNTGPATVRVGFLTKVNKNGANALTFMVERKF